jgi:hypothetical protein
MNSERWLAYDAAVVMMKALTRVCASDPKAGRRARRAAIREMEGMVVAPQVRTAAVRAMERCCRECGACKGV